jgi:hypothetical protein
MQIRTVKGLLLLLSGLAACGPNLMDEPTEFTGDTSLSIGVLCSTTSVSVGEQMWAKFATRHAEDVVPMWGQETLEVKGGVIKRRAAGRDVQKADKTWNRFETYWVEAPREAQSGDRVQVGPLTVTYSRGGKTRRRHISGVCLAEVK